MLAQQEAERLSHTVSFVEAKALTELLADTLSEAEFKTLSVKVSDVWAKALIDRLPDSLVEVEAETLTRDQKQGPRNKGKHGQCKGLDTGRHGR